MDTQDQTKNQTSAHESHGVHLCHKCGWPFPNPHPSARHRRTHKKICGTIDGYKLVDSQGTVSDDEQASDDDLKTPSPKLLERSINERGSGGIGERSNRSEDEVFTDAVAEFPDSGSNLANVEFAEKIKQLGRLTTIESFKDAESTDISTERNQMQNVEACGSILSADKWDSQDHVIVNATLGLDAITSAEKQIEGSAHDLIEAERVSACNMSPPKAETETDAAKSGINSTDVCNSRQIDAKGDEEINYGSTRSILDNEVSSSDHSSTKLSNVDIVTSEIAVSSLNPELADVGFQFKEFQNSVDYKMPSNDIFPDFGSAEVADDTSHSAENRENAFFGIHSTASGNSGQVYDGKGEGNNNLHEFSVSDDMPSVADLEIMIKGFKDHKEGKLPRYVNTDALEVIYCIEDSRIKNDSSVPQSELCDETTAVSVSDSHGSEGYLEHKGLSSSYEAIATGVLSSDSHVSEGYLDQKSMSSNPVEVFCSKGETVDENKLEGIGSNADAMEGGVDPRDIAQLPEELVSRACKEDSSLITSLTQDTKLLLDVSSVHLPLDAAIGQATNVGCLDKTGKIDEAKAERSDAADHADNKRVTLDEERENNISNYELVISSENKVNARVNVHTDNHVPDSEDVQSERHDAYTKETAEIGSGSKLLEENCAGQEKTVPESAGNNQYLQFFSENAINVPEKLAESEYTHAVSVSSTQLNETESGGNNNVLLECARVDKGAGAEHSKDIMSDSCKVSADVILPQIKITETESTLLDRNLDSNEHLKELVVDDTAKIDSESVAAGIKSESDVKAELPEISMEDEDHKAGESTASPLDMVSFVQSSATIDHDHDKEFAMSSSVDKPESLLDEIENNCCAKQHTASVTEFSAGSSSQNSVEGYWGSVSVLSTISDIPAIADAESLRSNGLQVSADGETTSSNKQKAEVEASHSEKADMFEQPSFMTLVEPKPAKPSASEIQIPQNPQQSAGSLQAGWFPSSTHVVNESHGRKKNEEIIAKVTNWSTGKHHTPLKNLLGEANVEGKPKSPNFKENQPAVETTQKDYGTSVTTVNSILGHQEPVTDQAKKEAGREWNSPARYPADIKREKRKVKGRPYWAQFVCCSSVN